MSLNAVFIVWLLIQAGSSTLITLNLAKNGTKLEHFWTSTGFTVPSQGHDSVPQIFYLSHDVSKNLALIGSLPRGSVIQVRIHWLLDLVKIPGKSVWLSLST